MNIRFLFILCLLTLPFASAQDWTPRAGSSASIHLDYRGPDAPSTLRIETDPPVKGELTADIHHRGEGELYLDTTLVRPATRPGLHEFEAVLARPGDWGVWLRYGLGIETFDAYARFPVTTEGQTLRSSTEFRGAMAANVPRWVQPMGFAVFGFFLLLSLIIIIQTLTWFERAKTSLT